MSSPCPSSHASMILAAALQKPAPSPPRAPGPAKSISGSPSDSIDKSSSPRSQPVYHYYGLASSSTGDSLDEDDEPMEPLLLVSAAGNTSTDISMTTFDVFGPVHYPGTHLRTYEQRQVQADVAAAARVRILRTAAWIRKLRRDFARGSSAIAGDGDAIAK